MRRVKQLYVLALLLSQSQLYSIVGSAELVFSLFKLWWALLPSAQLQSKFVSVEICGGSESGSPLQRKCLAPKHDGVIRIQGVHVCIVCSVPALMCMSWRMHSTCLGCNSLVFVQ